MFVFECVCLVTAHLTFRLGAWMAYGVSKSKDVCLNRCFRVILLATHDLDSNLIYYQLGFDASLVILLL